MDLPIALDAGRSLLDLIAIEQDAEDLRDVEVDVLTRASVSPYLSDRVLREAVLL